MRQLFSLTALLVVSTFAAAAERKPNILVIVSDDQGYADVGVQGCKDVPTPNLDALAKSGTRFTSGYVSGPYCSPTRAGLLTGRYQTRFGHEFNPGGKGPDVGLPLTETTIADRFKKAGYATALVGKWHLGYEPKFLPDRHGFDHSFGPLGGAVDYFHHAEPGGEPMLYQDGKPVRRDGYLTDLITAEAERVIRGRPDRPFFLYVPYTAPHSPFQTPGDRPEKPVSLEESERGTRETYRAMVEHPDRGVGRLLAALDEARLADRTLVVFASDNGGAKYARNAPFSGAKGGLFEGGIRVPCVARWPGVLPAGAEFDQPTATFDLTASILRAAGAEPPADRPLDGIDVLKLVAEQRPIPPRPLFWRARRGERTWRAVRDGSLKYVSRQDGNQVTEDLFDLARDPAEKDNLLARRPADADRLKGLLATWERDVRPNR